MKATTKMFGILTVIGLQISLLGSLMDIAGVMEWGLVSVSLFSGSFLISLGLRMGPGKAASASTPSCVLCHSSSVREGGKEVGLECMDCGFRSALCERPMVAKQLEHLRALEGTMQKLSDFETILAVGGPEVKTVSPLILKGVRSLHLLVQEAPSLQRVPFPTGPTGRPHGSGEHEAAMDATMVDSDMTCVEDAEDLAMIDPRTRIVQQAILYAQRLQTCLRQEIMEQIYCADDLLMMEVDSSTLAGVALS